MKAKRYMVFDFETNTKKVYTDKDVKIYGNYMERTDASQDLINKVAKVTEALAAAAIMLEDISFEDLDPGSRIAGIFEGHAQQLQQQIDTLESLIQ